MTGPRMCIPSTKAMTQEAFSEFLGWFHSPGMYEEYVRRSGKPRVRVPVERQVPNEADL